MFSLQKQPDLVLRHRGVSVCLLTHVTYDRKLFARDYNNTHLPNILFCQNIHKRGREGVVLHAELLASLLAVLGPIWI